MPSKPVASAVVDSVFDRLAGDLPPMAEGSIDAVHGRLVAIIRRDVEDLLNARPSPEPIGEEYAEVARSVVGYGLPDIDAMSADTPAQREEMCRLIRSALSVHEPRIVDVVVQSEPAEPDALGACRFVIEGRLASDDGSHVAFSTQVEFSTGKTSVQSSE